MTERPTLLARLAGKLSNHPETVATEALGHILSVSEGTREALRGFLKPIGTDLPPIGRVQTEATGDEGERPDLSCRDSEGWERVLVECKFWAGLTENQPVTYLERLPDDRASALLVVSPSRRLETLWQELKRRTGGLELHSENRATEMRWAEVDNNRRLVLTSWRHLLEKLADASGDPGTLNDIRQLQGLAEQQDSEAFLPLRPEQLEPGFPRLMGHLNRLVDRVSSRILQPDQYDWAERKRMQKRWEDGPFQYMAVAGFNTWFGVNFPYWAKYEETPLWFGFQESAWEHEDDIVRKLGSLCDEDHPRYKSEEGIIPIHLKVGVEYDEVVDDVVRQLADIARLLQAPVPKEPRADS